MPYNTTHPPLVEPDVRISRIRLSRKLSPQAYADSCAVGLLRPLQTGFQIHQPHPFELFVVAHPFRRSERPLAATPHMPREALSRVPVDLPVPHPRISIAKVVCPSSQVQVHLLDKPRQRLKTHPAARHLSQLCPFPRQRLRRRAHVQVFPPAPFQVQVVPKRVSQKVQARSFFLQVHHPRLLPVDLQSHPGLYLLFDPLFKLRTHIARQHHKVIRITHQFRPSPVCRSLSPMKHHVEPMQVQVRQQRRYYSAWWGSLLRASHRWLSTFTSRRFNHRRFQPHSDQPQHAPICYSHSQTCHQPLVWDRIKVAFQVRVIYRLIPGLHMPAYLLKRLMRTASGAKPVRAIFKVCFEDRLQYEHRRRLHYSVAHPRNAQRPELPVRLRYPDASYRCWLVGLRAKRFVYFIHQRFCSIFGLFDLFDRLAVDSGRAPVLSHYLPRRHQHIAPIDPVIQHIKPELRFLLCLLAQLLSQKRNFLRQSPVALRLLFLSLPVFRSGTFVQAVLPSSYFSMFSVRPLRSTIITRFFATMGLSDSRPEPPSGYFFPLGVALRSAGSPRFLGRSFHARCPLPPRRVRRLHSPVASPPVAGFVIFGSFATLTLRHEAEPGSLALRLACSPREASSAGLLLLTLAWLIVERAINNV